MYSSWASATGGRVGSRRRVEEDKGGEVRSEDSDDVKRRSEGLRE